MSALYNEIEPYACDWLEGLSREGHIARGAVERRSIADLKPEDVADATQFHAFAGIGCWSVALRLAGVADDDRVWTGSCPCQPFSAAGRARGFRRRPPPLA
jgi:DNA (cytosine-5)-methyltransferase 1